MPLTPEQQQELSELRRLDELEAQFGKTNQAPQEEPGMLQRMGNSLVENAPYIGGAIGAVGGLPGVALGGALGGLAKTGIRSIQDQGAQNFVSKKPTLEGVGDASTGAVEGAGEATGAEVGGNALSKMLGGALNKGKNFISTAARRSGILDRVKDPAGLARSVKDEVTSALGQYNQNEIKPQSDALKSFLRDKSIPVRPEELRGVSPKLDRYADVLKKQSGFDTVPVDASASAVNRAKQLAAQEAGYAKSKPFSEASHAAAEEAEKVASNLRSKVSDLGPEVGERNMRLQDMIQTRNRIKDMSDTDPIGAIQGRLGGTKSSLIADVDKGAGSNLGQLGKDIELAQTRLGHKGIPESMSALIHRITGTVPRAGGALAEKIEPHASNALGNSAKFIESELAKKGIKLTPTLSRALSQGDE